MKKTSVAIVGVGLIGGSLGQALRKSGRYRVIGIARRAGTLRQARRSGAIDEGTTDLALVASADIVVIGTPVDHIIPTLHRLAPHLHPGTWVTDVGSVKAPIMTGAARALKAYPQIHFAGSHPLAGSHKTGVGAAQPTLYKKSTCVIVPLGKSSPSAVVRLWRTAGARTLVLSAAQHDAAVALTSHLPHLLAHALVHQVVARRDRKLLKALMAGSFRDVTRVAASDPEQWTQIFQANRPALRRALAGYRRELSRLERSLNQDHQSLVRQLRRSQAFREPLFDGK